ncbi:hypothetical protein BDN72DRAFT_848351 [Pluteus cervinus]|uniref:Uncharacterized protein n=1 Tax=Pluteus cervinus TaxID=181527 RepID=A0ACD3AAY5_9AGAR|nr:hypothetical protein BDN72DRAFT_848351 [Pluteus cervinus]
MAHFSTTHPPIFRLPVELTLDIFREAAQDPSHLGTIFIVSWVCRRWRDIALQNPSLWTDIDVLIIEFVRASLTRCQGRPASFSINVCEDEDYEPYPIAPILHSLGQIGRLEITGDYRGEFGRTESTDAWMTPAPSLKHLRVSYCDFPVDVFSGVAPCLEHLHLHNCDFDFDTFPRLPALKSLHLGNDWGWKMGSVISARQFVDKLQWSPLLSTLSFEFGLGQVRSGEPGWDERLLLPELRRLSMKLEWASGALQLLNHITIPTDAEIVLDLYQDRYGDCVLIMDALRRCRTAGPPVGSMHSLQMRVAHKEPEHKYYLTERPEEGEIVSLSISFNGRLPLELAERSLQELRLGSLEAFDVAGTERIPAVGSMFWSTFASLPNLRTIEVHHLFAPSFVEHFCLIHRLLTRPALTVHPDKIKKSRPLLVYPALQTLLYEDFGGALNEHVKQLIHGLSVRAAAGRGLTKITVIGSVPLDEEVLDNLKGVVGEVSQITRG